jgi:poly(3-hydroxyoctanoate) depolymerase
VRFAFLPLVLCLACSPYVATKDPGDAADGGSTATDGGADSRCAESAASLHCAHHTLLISPGGLGLGNREVHWQVPLGDAPDGGWPVVLMFQGSFFSADTFWDAAPTAKYGGWFQTHVTRALLDTGFAVITPKTRLDGNYYWDTNVIGFSETWTSTDDHHLMLQIFAGIGSGQYGALSATRWYATGISSGGYMTSRMALSYPGKFRALAVVAASWATCAGALCTIPSPLPSDHPPTLFLHGERDEIVPISTMRPYAAALTAQSTDSRVVTDADAGHAWLDVAPGEVQGWFAGH